jgi:hypothetical protein
VCFDCQLCAATAACGVVLVHACAVTSCGIYHTHALSLSVRVCRNMESHHFSRVCVQCCQSSAQLARHETHGSSAASTTRHVYTVAMVRMTNTLITVCICAPVISHSCTCMASLHIVTIALLSSLATQYVHPHACKKQVERGVMAVLYSPCKARQHGAGDGSRVRGS